MAKDRKRVNQTNIALDASKQKKFNQKVHRIKKNVKDEPAKSGVVYISHLPWGFEEKPMKEYFKQFGVIKQLKVARSKKTGNPRGFAYIQFAHDEVAKIVAETMNNYLMFGKLIKCRHLLNPHPNTFKNAGRKFVKPMGVAGAINKHNSVKSEEAVNKSQSKALGKLAKLQAKLAAQGIEYKLEDDKLSEAKERLKQKRKEAWEKLRETKKVKQDKTKKKLSNKDKIDEEDNDDDSDEDDDEEDDSDDESGSDVNDSDESDESDISFEEDIVEVTQNMEKNKRQKTPQTLSAKNKGQKTPENVSIKNKGQKTPENVSGIPTPVDSGGAGKKSAKKSNKRKSVIPSEVDTPKGKMNILIEDSSEDEISFKTPPLSIKSSKLVDTLKSMKDTPVTAKKRSPKRKLEAKTPVSESKNVTGMVTPDEAPLKKAKFLSKSAQKVKTPKVSEVIKVPKSVQKMDTRKVDSSENELSTPKNAGENRGRRLSGSKSATKKKLPSASKRKLPKQ